MPLTSDGDCDFALKSFASETSKRRVSYFYDPDVGSYYYGPGHPMKPQRMRMTHSLIQAYQLYSSMDVYRPHKALESELVQFHDPSYVAFLSTLTTNRSVEKEFINQTRLFNVGEMTDCPIFDGVYPFQRSCAGASVDAAVKLNQRQTDIAINWSGGLHHAKRAEASGFCYINDIVMGILELLKYHARVLYVDIDIHHGDGVEEAFFTTPRVMTVSFHKYGDYFPGTGDVIDIGAGQGKNFTVNVPLDDGISDPMFISLYKKVMTVVIDKYKPGAVVVQCGADSVSGDRLGRFNLSIGGHAECVAFLRSYNIPLMVLGGGGYTIRNVARTWLYETAVCLGVEGQISDHIPHNEYTGYYGMEGRLHLPLTDIPNNNTAANIEALQERILERLRLIEHVPSVEFSYVPPDLYGDALENVDEDEVLAYELDISGGGKAQGDLARQESVAIHNTNHEQNAMLKNRRRHHGSAMDNLDVRYEAVPTLIRKPSDHGANYDTDGFENSKRDRLQRAGGRSIDDHFEEIHENKTGMVSRT